MPIYEYACKACGHEAEILHGISEPSPKKCPACGKPKLEKLVSAAGFRLAGGGWYETDFKSGNKKNLIEKESAKAEGPKADAPKAESPKGEPSKPKAEPKGEPKAESKKAAKKKTPA